jgi:SAM-dependent methyltransferase
MDKQYSPEGRRTLDAIDQAPRFTDWMYQQIRPYLRGDIWEIGSGSGTYSKKIVRDFPEQRIVLSDIDEAACRTLRERFGAPRIAVESIDLEKNEDLEKIKIPIQSAFALNVLEHIADDVLALRNIHARLSAGGRFVLLVPAHTRLFNRIDRTLGHRRRYTKKELVEKIGKTPFRIERLYYFNSLAMAGWFWSGSIMSRSIPGERAVRLYDRLVPALRFLEKRILRRRLGISLIAVLKKEIPAQGAQGSKS